jgi:hypothetical protein
MLFSHVVCVRCHRSVSPSLCISTRALADTETTDRIQQSLSASSQATLQCFVAETNHIGSRWLSALSTSNPRAIPSSTIELDSPRSMFYSEGLHIAILQPSLSCSYISDTPQILPSSRALDLLTECIDSRYGPGLISPRHLDLSSVGQLSQWHCTTRVRPRAQQRTTDEAHLTRSRTLRARKK